MHKTITGLEHFIESPPSGIRNARLGLLCNPASVDSHYRHARHCITKRFPGRLRALYSPQHGFFAEKQDNMIESADMVDPELGLPVFSLYGQSRVPDRDMFDPIDILLVDLQDVGTRVYTFVYTLSYCMEAARRYDRKVVVLDRPNPMNGLLVEGSCLDPAFASFVGRYPIPMRHGLTIGELARLFNETFDIGCDLEIVPLQNWQRWMYFRATGLPWVAPSPNLPTPESAVVYPGQVIWEGTNISEGRGTTQPFEIFGAPFIKVPELEAVVMPADIPGICLRPVSFEPTSNKWEGQRCNGFQLHVTAPDKYRPFETSLRLLAGILKVYPDDFQWKAPPYEYEYEKLPIDLILGGDHIRIALSAGATIAELQAEWQPDLESFVELSRSVHMYR
ncbi:MAG: Protein YzbB [Olavius algarvensis Delta 4 endosymbiont]|nr:MAG: Protein YzbB [Olavius algarvensis Delta 4 endosymbiont]